MAKWKYTPGVGWQNGTPAGAGQIGLCAVVKGKVLKPERKYDAPTDAEIKANIAADEKDTLEAAGMDHVFKEAKTDLASGKLKIHPDVLRVKDRRVVQHAVVPRGDDGGEMIVPAHLAPKPKPMPEPAPPPKILARAAKENIQFEIEAPKSATPLPGDTTTTLKAQMRKGFNAILNSDGASHKRRTV